jgi:hypothetical protein
MLGFAGPVLAVSRRITRLEISQATRKRMSNHAINFMAFAGACIRKFSAHILRCVHEELRRAAAEQPYLDGKGASGSEP